MAKGRLHAVTKLGVTSELRTQNQTYSTERLLSSSSFLILNSLF